ncbi:MAG TPA: VIT domain-containing protein [Anaerolineae bacterium]|nr:VIT domain-containing protein [Anaerolineae bacterium]
MFNPKMYLNTRPDGVGVLQVVGEETTGGPQFVPLKRTELRGDIIGPLAALTVTHTYGYRREVCDKVLEAVYRFPLPGDAAVTGARVRFGDVEIIAQLKERAQAETEYQEAVQQGKQAALLTREAPDVFTLRVAGIQPDEEVLVTTTYVQLARPHGDQAGWLLRVPLTTAPRYVRQDDLETRHAQGQPLALLRDPGHRFALDLRLRDVGDIASPTHRLDILLDERAHDRRIQLRDGEVIPDRDFVLTWTPAQSPDRPTLSVLLHTDQAAGQTYFLALVAPPSEYQQGSGKPREIALLVDHSGSMNGAKWQAADWTVNNFLGRLNPHDSFALGLFHNTTKWFKPGPTAATEANLRAAAEFLDRNRDSGGTELGVALEQALKLKRGAAKDGAHHVLIVTDAQVSDAGRLFRLADAEATQKLRRRISILCIDAAPNSFLAQELAERGGGVAYFLTSSPDEEDVTTALSDVLADWDEPILVGMQLTLNCARGEASGYPAAESHGQTVIDLGDLPCGRAVWVVGRVPAGDGLTFSLTSASREMPVAIPPVALTEAEGGAALKALFGARRLLGLEYLMHARYEEKQLQAQLRRMGYDPAAVMQRGDSVYAENVYKAAVEALKPLLVQESLAYGIACSETAFIAVRTEAGKPVEASVAVANALPAGWSDDFLGAPMGFAAGAGMPVMRAMAMPSVPPSPQAAAADSKAVFKLGKQKRESSARPRDMAHYAATEAEPTLASRGDVDIFSGVPVFQNGEAVLFDSTQTALLPEQATLTSLTLHFVGGGEQKLDRGLQVQLYVGDLALPRATIRLSDLLRGPRPLNLRKMAGQVVRVVLVDANGGWASGAPEIRVTLGM